MAISMRVPQVAQDWRPRRTGITKNFYKFDPETGEETNIPSGAPSQDIPNSQDQAVLNNMQQIRRVQGIAGPRATTNMYQTSKGPVVAAATPNPYAEGGIPKPRQSLMDGQMSGGATLPMPNLDRAEGLQTAANMQAARIKWYSDLTRSPEQIAAGRQNIRDRYAAQQVQHTTEGTERQFGLTKATQEQGRQQLEQEARTRQAQADQATAQAAENAAKQTAAEGQKLHGQGALAAGQGELAKGNAAEIMAMNAPNEASLNRMAEATKNEDKAKLDIALKTLDIEGLKDIARETDFKGRLAEAMERGDKMEMKAVAAQMSGKGGVTYSIQEVEAPGWNYTAMVGSDGSIKKIPTKKEFEAEQQQLQSAIQQAGGQQQPSQPAPAAPAAQQVNKGDEARANNRYYGVYASDLAQTQADRPAPGNYVEDLNVQKARTTGLANEPNPNEFGAATNKWNANKKKADAEKVKLAAQEKQQLEQKAQKYVDMPSLPARPSDPVEAKAWYMAKLKRGGGSRGQYAHMPVADRPWEY